MGNGSGRDSLRALRAFAQVARLGSVSRAAAALGVSQPAVTQHLQALARDHGVALLERSGRRLVPTAAGDALLALARPLVDGMDGLGAALQARLRAEAPASVTVAAGTVALRTLLPTALAALAGDGRAAGPVDIRHAGGRAALDLLREGRADLAVGSWLDVPGDIAVTPILDSPARLVVPAGHPLAAADAVAPRDLARHPLLLPAGRQTARLLVDLAFARAGTAMPVPREAGSWDAVLALVALGQGVTLSNALALAGRQDPRVVVRPLPDGFPPRPYGVAMRRGRTLRAAARAVADALRDAAASAA